MQIIHHGVLHLMRECQALNCFRHARVDSDDPLHLFYAVVPVPMPSLQSTIIRELHMDHKPGEEDFFSPTEFHFGGLIGSV